MIAYQQQHQQQGSVAPNANPSTPNSVSAVPPASILAANSKLRFGNTGIASWDTTSTNDSTKSAKNDQFSATPKSFGAPTNGYRLNSGNVDVNNNNSSSSTHARKQQGSRGNHRNVNPAFAAPTWQNYHNHYQQLHQQKEAAAAASKGRSNRRIPNASDINKQWRAPAQAVTTTATTAASTISKVAAVSRPAPMMSSTYQANDSTVLSGLSLALNKHNVQNAAVPDSPITKAGFPLFDASQARSPNPLSPAISMKTPGYVDPESLPFELGSSITDITTGRQYTLLSVLGEGSYAVVYLARSSHDGGKYALKCLSKLGLTARQLSLQRTELDIHSSVCPHPHIVTLYSHFETRDWLFLVMERVAGPDLYDYITQHPSFNANQEERRFIEATRLFGQMIDAVAHIHALKAYHRDLKPENFILGADGNLKLTDFGLATRESLSTDFECGSKPYMSYENRNGGLNPKDPTVYGPRDDYSPRLSDVWALGVLFLNLLFAQSPWTDPSRESCFKFCRFLREGAGFLVSQFPKLPREVGDFLVTRIFSPESGRCNVLELKQWVQDLGYPFNLPKSGSGTVSRPIATRHKNISAGRRPANTHVGNSFGAGAGASSYGKSYMSGSIGKKWSPTNGVVGGNLPKMPYVPQAILASTALALDSAMAAAAAAAAPSAKPKSPHNKRFAAMQPVHMPGSGFAAHPTVGKANHMSTSVPAAVFSQIIPATQAAAARQMMPREFNPTAAKAAAAILQSSMLCLPKNGLGQGKLDKSVDMDGMDVDEDENDDSMWNPLENLSEAAEEEEEEQRSETMHSIGTPNPPKKPVSSSLGFSLSKNFTVYDTDEDMDFSKPILFDDPPMKTISLGAKSLPAHTNGVHMAIKAANKRPLPVSAATITPTTNPATDAMGRNRSSMGSDGSSFSDDFDVLGHFSDEDHNSSIAGAVAITTPTRTVNRVRFNDIPQAQAQAAAVVPLARPGRVRSGATDNAASADSSLTATLVTSSVEYYSPRMKPISTVMPVSAPMMVNSDDIDADDEADGNWRTRGKHSAAAGAAAAPKGAATTFGQAPRSIVHFGSRHHPHQIYKAHENIGNRVGVQNHISPVPVAGIASSVAAKYAGIPVMHSLPTPFKSVNSHQSKMHLDAQQPTFSWADDVEELPIPSLSARLGNALIDVSKPVLFGDETLSDELSWSSEEDDHFQPSDGMFAMEL